MFVLICWRICVKSFIILVRDLNSRLLDNYSSMPPTYLPTTSQGFQWSQIAFWRESNLPNLMRIEPSTCRLYPYTVITLRSRLLCESKMLLFIFHQVTTFSVFIYWFISFRFFDFNFMHHIRAHRQACDTHKNTRANRTVKLFLRGSRKEWKSFLERFSCEVHTPLNTREAVPALSDRQKH